MIYLTLLAIALIVNSADRRMLMLVTVAASTWFAEPPRHSYEAFFAFCIVAELIVITVAYSQKCPGSSAVIVVRSAMLLVHVASLFSDAYPPLSTPRLIMPALEHAELVACIVLSKPLIGRIRNYESSTV